MKTIKDKGKVYQVGAVYEFSVDGKHWYGGTLKAIYPDPERNYPYKTRSGDYRLIRVYKASLGTIEEAPVELIDGECYQYKDEFGNTRKGFFMAEQGLFYRTGSWSYRSECTNIKLLTVGEQK